MTVPIVGQNNPYIIGRPIYEKDCFFGREDLFQFIQDNLIQGAKVILLHGQRRIGKSSVLSQIPNFVQLEQFIFVPLSLEGKSRKPLSEILYELAVEIKDYLEDELELSVNQVIVPTKKALESNQQVFAKDFLPQVYQALGDKNLVLLLDEFDVLGDSQDSASEHFFFYLKSVLDKQERLEYRDKSEEKNKLFIIPVIGRQLDDMPNLLSLFRNAPNQIIGLLEKRKATRLIVEPARGVLEYEPDAIDAILELSAGHPYFTQVICFAIFSQARDERRFLVTRKDVKSVIDKAIENGEAGLIWFRDGLPIPERVVFAAVAEAQQIANQNAKRVFGMPLCLLQEYGVILTEPLKQAGKRLVEWDFLEPTTILDESYQVKVELVRRWLLKQHPLRREIWGLEKLNPEANRIYELAVDLRQRRDLLTSVLNLYEQVLVINSNHFKALFELAEIYLEIEAFDKAVELYTRAYQVDSTRNQEGFVRSLLNYGNQLINEGKSEQAKEQFNQVLTIQPDNALAINRLKEMGTYREKLDIQKFFRASNPSKPIDGRNIKDLNYFIDFSSARNGNLFKAFRRTIHLSPEQPTCQFFTGYIGCGKTTELLRLKVELEKQGFHVVYLSSSEVLDMADVDISDILLAIAFQVVQSLEAVRINLRPKGFRNLLQQATEILQIPIDTTGLGEVGLSREISLSFGLGNLTAQLKNSFKIRTQLRKYLEPRTNMILDIINYELLETAKIELQKQSKKGLVVIVDNLDRVDNRTMPFGRTLPDYLFVDRGEDLKKLNCHLVYTVPVLLLFSNELGFLRNRFGVEPKVLPMVAVRFPSGEICEEGMQLLQQMVLARAFPEVEPVQRLSLITEVFDTPETLNRLCLLSGGHIRNLLSLLHRCLMMEDPPLSRDCLEQVLRDYSHSLTLAITEDDWKLLRRVKQTKTVKGVDEYNILLRSLLVFEYQYRGQRWFDLNPILAEARELQEVNV